MEIQHIDNIVLTVANIEKTVQSYTTVMGFKCVNRHNRIALTFGNQKIGKEFEP